VPTESGSPRATKKEHTMESIADARRIAALNEQVRRVTALSRAMNLTVTHAMLAARQAGERGRKRTTQTEEMRGFGRELDHALNQLHHFISRLVRGLLGGGAGAAPVYRLPQGRARGRQLLGRAGPRWEWELAHCREPVPAEWAGLCRKLRHALHLAETALALVRAAGADAAGQGMEASLRHAAEEVGMTARRVRESIARMNATAPEGGGR